MELVDVQKKITPVLLRHGVLHASIFGSYARGEQTPKSDLDVLVAFPEHATLIDVVRLSRDLEDAVQKKVDIVSYNSIHHSLRSSILADEIAVI